MSPEFLMAEANECRRHAVDLNEKPEASVLLRIASYFEELAGSSMNAALPQADRQAYREPVRRPELI